MGAPDELASRFEAHRGDLRALAYRMLGSAGEAEDAVQEVWPRLARVEVDEVANLAGWLRTVLSRVCLDMLRARRARRESLLGHEVPDPGWEADPSREADDTGDPERAALRVDSVGRALLVVLDRLGPTERVAFVLHDLFAVPFDEIAPIVDRSPVATRKLASRARARVRGTPTVSSGVLAGHRRVVEVFLAAARHGDLDALLAVLAPDVVRRADPAALPPGAATEVRGARGVAEATTVFGRRSRLAAPALINGDVGVVVAPHGRLAMALTFTIAGDRISGYTVIADPTRLAELDLAVLDDLWSAERNASPVTGPPGPD